MPTPFSVCAEDGFEIHGFLWRMAEGPDAEAGRPLVVVNPATSVRCRYYARFAAYLVARGFDVVTYDYRGIGVSRPPSLRRFAADWVDWGRLDFEAVLGFAAARFPGRPIDVVAHSIGGFVIGLAPSSHLIRRIFTFGAQFAYWRDYAPARRAAMLLKWHVAMPLVTSVFGYFPGSRLGWMEDTPSGVVRDWSRMGATLEASLRRGSLLEGEPEGRRLARQFGRVTAPILAVGADDDPFGTVAALERLLGYYTAAPRIHLRLDPAAAGVAEIGHFAFFHSRFEPTLWPIALAWLAEGRLAEPPPGRLVREAVAPPEEASPRVAESG